ncbi:PREDICTED: T-box transcription factor TBX6-like isoform X2 [Nelumbo nucifera]|uniref:T-box transcription factor TBX6-like isoform X2 n=1 Tax=Nelumbo nucifera TaxID=4432 RepID=A0A1U8QBA9_NELNU|nr:PREDICTED: T-box transcription factor TBX6-like isoform X2 [Nelumbo nucifera]
MSDRTARISSGGLWTDLSIKDALLLCVYQCFIPFNCTIMNLILQNVPRPQKEALSEPVHEKNSSAGYGDYEYRSDISRHSDLVVGRATERVPEREGLDKPWYGAGSKATDAIVSQRNGFESRHGFQSYRAPRSAQPVAQLHQTQSIANRSSRGISRNWKNSEEEEYMWDDMNSRLTDHGALDSSRGDGWTPDDAEKQEVEEHLSQTRSEREIGSRIKRETSMDPAIAQKGQDITGHRTSSGWSSQKPFPVDGLINMGIASLISGKSEGQSTSICGLSTSMSSSFVKAGHVLPLSTSVVGAPSIGSLTTSSTSFDTSTGVLGPHHQPPGPASPSGQLSIHQSSHSPSSSVVHQHQPSHSMTDEPGPKTSLPPGPLNQIPQISSGQDSFPLMSGTLPSNQSQTSQYLHTSSSSISLSQLRHVPFTQQQPELNQSQPSGQTQKPLHRGSISGTPQATEHPAQGHSNSPAANITGETDTSSLLAAIMKSGLLSKTSVSGSLPNLNFQDSGALPSNLNIHPPLPSGPPPVQLATSSASMVASASVSGLDSSVNVSSLTANPQRAAVLPPLPPGPPPLSSLVGSTTSQTSNIASAVPKPLSNLLSSLLAKGLISASTTESPTLTTTQLPTQPQNHCFGPSSSSSILVSSGPISSTIPTTSGKELHSLKSEVNSTISSSQITTEAKDLIGIEFKPEIIREPHQSVINALFDDTLHHCNVCGLRLKLKERLDRHMEWHASKQPESIHHRASRRWYTSLNDWVSENGGLPSGSMGIASMQVLVKELEKGELMIPADESQCICALCGELFEDFYSHERDEWMFKGAVYMTIPVGEGNIGTTDKSAAQGPIVHSNCISQSSVYDLGLMEHIKTET